MTVNPHRIKYSSLPKFGNDVDVAATRPKEEGRIAIVTNAGRAAVDADHTGANGYAGRATVSEDLASSTGADHVRQNRVVLAPGVCAPSVAVMRRPDRARASAIRKATGAIVHRSPGRARHKPSNHCAGKAGMSWLHLYAAVQLLTTQNSHSGPRVPAGSRSSLRPLSFQRVRQVSKARAKCAARLRSCIRDGDAN